LIAVFRIALRLHDLDPGPVGLEFVGKHHRQAGLDTSAHLGAVRDDGDEAALVDRHVDVGFESGR
jgi:hypothetical protein